MSYEVTATRRRPQRFEDLVGQEFVAETFRNAIQAKKIAHAYLFSGPRGCGKTSTARILAKALNCAEGPTATPCGHCQQCVEITKGTCTDVIEIDGASNTSVNDIRQIKDEVLFPPQSCKYKIYIIDEVHMLSTSAFNALLKTIEEPPPYVIFIFATTELQKVPATIKSRCQQFNFRLVPIEKVKEQLALAAQEIGIKAEDEALYWIARESTGSMRDAYTLFDQVAAFSGNEITYDKIRDKLGLVGVDRLNAIFEDCAANQTQAALEKLDTFLQAGISIEQLISNATDYLRSLLLIKNGITKEALLGQSAERYSQKVLGAWNPIQIERAVSIFLNLYRDIRYSLSPRYELELAFSRLCWLSQYVSPAEVKNAIDKAKALLMGGAAGSNAAAGSSPATGGNVTPGAVTGPTPGGSLTPGVASGPQPVPAGGTTPAGSGAHRDFLNLAQETRQSFSNGGAEPPYQAAAQTNTAPVQDISRPAPENYAPAPEGSYAPDNYSPAPEGSYAPDDSFAPEDDFAGAGFAPDQGSSQTPAFVPEEAPEGPVKDMAQLKKAVLSELSLSENDAILATTLMQTDGWTLQGDVIATSVASSFTQGQLVKQIAKLNAVASKYFGSSVRLNIAIRQARPSIASVSDAPREIQLLCSLFRGQIVAKGEKMESARPQELVPKSGEDDSSDDMTQTNNSIDNTAPEDDD